jgi:hypothetical protein
MLDASVAREVSIETSGRAEGGAACAGPVRRVQRVRHELKRRDVEVARVEALGSELVRVVFCGESLADFVSLGFDDHIKFIIGADRDGEPVRRDYTPRAFDAAARELTIDFAMRPERKGRRDSLVSAPSSVAAP